MRHAPPVSLRCSGGVLWRLLQTGLWTAAAAALFVWLCQRWDGPVWWSLVPVSKVMVLAWVLTRPRSVALSWDGHTWRVAGQPGQLTVMLDFDRFLLLRWRATGVAAGRALRWLPVTASEAGSAWLALRVAAHSRPPQVPSAVPE